MKIRLNIAKLRQDMYDKCWDAAMDYNYVVCSREFRANLRAELQKEEYRHPDAEKSTWGKKGWDKVYNHITGHLAHEPYTLMLSDYWRPSSATGKVSGNYILFNRRYFFSMGEKGVGSFFIHEQGHIRWGFDHDFWDSPRRRDSLCYLLNRVFEKTYDQLFGPTKPKPKKKTIWDYILPWRWF